jgi:hypothetical protein
MLIFFSISMLVDTEKEWDSYKMEVIIKKRWEIIIKKVNRKLKYLFLKKEIFKLENEISIF